MSRVFLPKCHMCGEIIQDENRYNIEGGYVCEECVDKNFTDWFDNYDENPICDFCGCELYDKFYRVNGDKLCPDCFNDAYRETNLIEYED